jgi:regulation of enolase protein 1 (concanavalin A-like superfamily)
MKLIHFSLVFLSLASPLAAAEKTIEGIGSVTDPAGDSKINGDASGLTIVVAAGDHALATERKSMAAPRVLHEITGDFVAEVTVSGDFPQNASTKVPNRFPFQAAGLLLWVDSGTYVRFERAQANVTWEDKQQHYVYPSWELRFAGKALRLASPVDGTLSTNITKLRLTRAGTKLTAALSEDGTTWREMDPINIPLPEKLQIGVSASHNTENQLEAEFENFKVTPLAQRN